MTAHDDGLVRPFTAADLTDDVGGIGTTSTVIGIEASALARGHEKSSARPAGAGIASPRLFHTRSDRLGGRRGRPVVSAQKFAAVDGIVIERNDRAYEHSCSGALYIRLFRIWDGH